MDVEYDDAVVMLTGPLDVRSTATVREAVYGHLKVHRSVVVDMTDVPWTDTTSLRMLAVATRTAERNGQHLTLRGCSPALRRTLHVTRMAHLLDVEPSRAGRSVSAR